MFRGKSPRRSLQKCPPHLKPEERKEAAEKYSRYLQVIAKIYDDLEEKGEPKDVLLKIQYENRNRHNDASQNDT